MMWTISRRRRNILLVCGAVAVGGYVTYRVYHSRTRLRVILFLESFSTLLEALAAGSDSFGVVLSDLQGFLVSGEDEIPQSLKQLVKLARSPEAQEGLSALTAAVSRGILSAVASGGSVVDQSSFTLEEEQPRRQQQSFQSRAVSSSEGASSFVETEKVFIHSSDSLEDRALSPGDDDENVEELSRLCDGGLDMDSGSVFDDVVKAQVDSSMLRGTKEALQDGNDIAEGQQFGKGELVDRMVEKLFSDSGKGFASAMVASASRGFATSVIEHMNSSSGSGSDTGSEERDGGYLVKALVSFARSADGKSLLANWIQTFVGTAVSVYLDKTKDINTFDQLADTLQNPEHRAVITDLFSSLCDASTSSFVRTSHEVLTSSAPASSSSKVSSPDVGELIHHDSTEGLEMFYDTGEQLESTSPTHSRRVQSKGSTNYIEQISKVIAVPSNRKLILDIAGTISSSAVRSTIDVSLGKVSAVLGGGKGKELVQVDTAPPRSGVGVKLQTVGDATRGVVHKSVVLMTLCSAVCLRSVFGGVPMLQPF